MEYMHLTGADDVRSAGHMIRQAAEDVRNAAGSMQEIGRPIQEFSMAVGSLENAIGAFGEFLGMQAANQQRGILGYSVAYDEDAFEEVLHRRGLATKPLDK